jgi:DNA-binding CsgD family transcriptional regulator
MTRGRSFSSPAEPMDTLTAIDRELSLAPRRPALIVVGSAAGLGTAGPVIRFDDRLEIGRQAGRGPVPGWRLPNDRHASREHARVVCNDGVFEVQDLGGRNGTWLEGARIEGSAEASDGSVIHVGEHVAVLRFLSDDALAAVEEEVGDPFALVPTLSPLLALQNRALRALCAGTAPLLLEGRTGTGKSVHARAIHARSGRTGALVELDCRAFAPPRLEVALRDPGELGARDGDEIGRLVAGAKGGTLFVDHLEALPPALLPKALHFLHTRSDVRLVASLTLGESTATAAGAALCRTVRSSFGGTSTRLPSLRHRREDIGRLVAEILAARPGWRLEPGAFAALFQHPWSGNLWELEDTVSGAVVTWEAPRYRGVPVSAPVAPPRPAPLAASQPATRIALPAAREVAYRDLAAMVGQFADEHGLSGGERETVRLAAEGLVSKEIAERRQQSVKTVDSYWARIYIKTGLGSQREILSALLRRALGAGAPDL